MKKFTKSIVKEFKSGFGRFLAIMAIIALGVGFLIGISQATPDMKTTMSDYLRSLYAYDIDIKAAYGLTQSDIDGVVSCTNDDGDAVIDGYTPVISTYAMASSSANSTEYAVNIISYDTTLTGNGGGESYLNRLELSDGRLPQAGANEVVAVHSNSYFKSLNVGDTVTLASTLDTTNSTYGNVYANSTFTVVGVVSSPDYYYSNARETTTIGTGVVGNVLIGDTSGVYDMTAFYSLSALRGADIVCTDLWVTVSGAKNYEMFSDSYKNYVLEQAEYIEILGNDICADINLTLSGYGATADASWYVLDRASSNVSYISFDMNVDKVEDIAGIFPAFFIVVAALVALTSMTKMVQDERVQIGTLKALGYKEGTIMSKYIIYCTLACIIGLVVGILLGFSILPSIFWQAYGTMYTLPALKLGFSWWLAISVVFGALALTILVTVFACRATTKEKPSKLMQPKAPKPGQRIALERAGFLWKHIKFKWKATIRNIFRYKKNMVLTIISVMGCTALILTGFGLGDSVDAVTELQYGDIIYYDTQVNFTGDIDEIKQGGGALADYLDSLDDMGDNLYIDVYTESGQLIMGGSRESVDLYLIKDGSLFSQFVSLHSRKSGKSLDTGADGIILPENIADIYEVEAGDTVTYVTSSGQSFTLTVSGVAEYYTGSQVYMSSDYFNSIMQTTAQTNTLLIKYGYGDDTQAMDAAAETLLADDNVTGVEFTYTTKNSYTSLSQIIGYVTLVLIICAGGLAVIVLYNLTNINIDERRKEIATLRVLGYTKRETAGYIYRESAILTVIGALLGLLLGWLLHMYIVGRVNSVLMMLGKTIAPLSYLYAFLLTIAFAVLIYAFMLIKLYRVNMAESLKSNE